MFSSGFAVKIQNAFDKNRKSVRSADGGKTKLDQSQKLAIFKKVFEEHIDELEMKLRLYLPEYIWEDVAPK